MKKKKLTKQKRTNKKEKHIMKLGKLSEFYYTAAEARRVLGVDESTFQYWGKEGRITRVILPGRKQPVYSKKEINDLAHEIEATVIMERAKGPEFRRATVDDLEEENQLAQLVFGRAAGVMPRKAYLEKNPEIDYHLYDHGKLVSYLTILPLKKEALTRFMRGEIRGWQINLDDIEQFEPGKPVECIIMDMVTTPLAQPIKRSEYGRLLIVNFLRTLQNWGEQGIEITKIHAIGGTSAGQHILRSANFKEVGQVNTGRFAFELDILNSDARLLRSYQEAIKKWKQQREKPATTTNSKRRSKVPINP